MALILLGERRIETVARVRGKEWGFRLFEESPYVAHALHSIGLFLAFIAREITKVMADTRDESKDR
jgi:hypothetical protein